MRPKFIQAVYFEGRILLFEEYGDVYEFNPRTQMWNMLCSSPWPRTNAEKATVTP